MADKRISQLVDRGTVANSDVVPIVVSGASTTNKATISSIQTFMQGNLDLGVTSVGLSMPSAFTVTGSPVTSSGNISVAGAGTVSQYIRGDGSLADFPSISGGGSSVSYYLNGSVSQGTIGGIAYTEMNKVPILGAGTDFTINADGYIASFITDAGDPALLQIPAGNWNFETFLQASSAGGSPSFYIELYKVDSGGTATLIASNSASPELISLGTSIHAYFSALAVPITTLALTDRLAIRYYVVHSGRTITLHTENNTLCQIITTFTTGLTALNGLTAQVQNFATGTSGTDFGISSSTSTHTFNLPTASATNRGALSSADWTTFNGKVGGTGAAGQVAFWNGTNTQTGDNGLFWDNTNKRLGVNTNSPTVRLQIEESIGTQAKILVGKISGNLASSTSGSINIAEGGNDNNITPSLNILQSQNSASNSGQIVFAKMRNSFGALTTNENLGTIIFRGSDGTALQTNASISGTNGGATNSGAISFSTNNAGTFSEKQRIFANGNVLIQNGGTFTDAGFRLDVNGTARVQNAVTINGNAIVNNAQSHKVFLNATTNGTSRFYIASSATGSSFNTGISFVSGTTSKWSIASYGVNSDFTFYNDALSADAFFINGNTNNIIIGGATDVTSAILNVNSTTKGFLPPRMTSAQRTAISSPATGLIVYQTDGVEGLYLRTSTAWRAITMV